jgi:CRISPR-associated endonuclease/helicase Cas3
MTGQLDFPSWFHQLWGYAPFPWQRMLAERLTDGKWPRALDLPTAAGKTACIDIAIWALAAQAGRPVAERMAPRRIWFVVDRRIVVDEAYERACRIAEKLESAREGRLKAVADRLFELSGTMKRPLATARLRGGVLCDDGWARLPSQPAVITSTVDQLGSRLLFRGYGHSSLAAPIFAGLAAHDSLIILDEAHLSVPFLETLRGVERFRGEDWAEEPIHTPFAFTMLSATPPSDIPDSECFPGAEREEALDHPELDRRLCASKPAELVELKSGRDQHDPLIIEAAERARRLSLDDVHERVAVVVNRVATAQAIAVAVGSDVGESADVVLLTGRLRPLDRDRLLDRWHPVLRANEPHQPERPVVVVATQTIEVGADFSFDALITEAASLDALRQRFGRLNRLGRPGPAPGAILMRAEQKKPKERDPVYGEAIPNCWQWLEAHAQEVGEGKRKKRVIDFGIKALDEALADAEDISGCLAPVSRAPMLLPAHLDLLCQTSPEPPVQPDIALYLHGAERGVPEVRVIWRSDLRRGWRDDGHEARTWPETVALCSPNSLETLTVPLHRLRRWLRERGSPDDGADVEGASRAEETTGHDRIDPVLRWCGRERSEVVRSASKIRPNDLVVLPAEYGIEGLGQTVHENGVDIWEAAHACTGRPAGLRLHRAVLEAWLACPPLKALVDLAENEDWDDAALREAIDACWQYQPDDDAGLSALPEWMTDSLERVRGGRVEQHPDRGLVLFARKGAWAREQDVFADDDDWLSATDQAVTLADHSASVERAVDQLARRCLPESFEQPLRAAAYWHDAGKLDERFQLLLRQGDELSVAACELLAKSASIPSSPQRRRALRQASGLPDRFRHEMVSLQLVERCASSSAHGTNDELIRHAIASHHGHARPFAPVSVDVEPPPILGDHDGVSIDVDGSTRADWPAPHSIESGVSDRFWRLTRRYGWWGLAYLEAILRLGDWYGGQRVFSGSPSREGAASAGSGAAVSARQRQGNLLQLTGVDGANPLGFLTALGTISVLDRLGYPDVRLRWRRHVTWQPELIEGPTSDPAELAALIADGLRGQAVSDEAEERRKEAQEKYDRARKVQKDKEKEIKDRRLRGKERQKAMDEEVRPLQEEAGKLEAEWRAVLRKAVPRPELALGRHIDCTADEYRNQARSLLADAGTSRRESLNLLAAFASDACRSEKPDKRNKGVVAATPFCFIAGSGHQYFLDFVRQLLERVNPSRVHSTLFEPWRYDDPGLSMRWDPIETRRYALMDRDPTASDNKPHTVWMANLLAYRALVLFPSAPQARSLSTVGWTEINGAQYLTWPLWAHPATQDTIRSLLLLCELYADRPDRLSLRERGISEVFRSRRIKVGTGAQYKLNFAPARAA